MLRHRNSSNRRPTDFSGYSKPIPSCSFRFANRRAGAFFERNGLLYLPTAELKKEADWLTRADALIGTLAADPSLRGTLDALSLGLAGVQRKEVALAGSHDDHGR